MLSGWFVDKLNGEHFKRVNTDNIQLNKNEDTISTDSGKGTCFGAKVIKTANQHEIHEWTFKAHGAGHIGIGIIDADSKWNWNLNADNFGCRSYHANYGYFNSGKVYFGYANNIEYGEKYGRGTFASDVITMILDVYDLTISWKKNDNTLKKIDIKQTEYGYKMACYLDPSLITSTISLISYKCSVDHEQNDSNEAKQNESKLVEEVSDLKMKIKSMEQENESIQKELESMRLKYCKLEDVNMKLMQEIKVLRSVNANKNDNNKLSLEQQKFHLWFEEELKLPEYHPIFVKNGFKNLELIKEVNITTTYLKEMGIDTLAHRMKILHCIIKLKQSNDNDNKVKQIKNKSKEPTYSDTKSVEKQNNNKKITKKKTKKKFKLFG